jgi:hypothetical protein
MMTIILVFTLNRLPSFTSRNCLHFNEVATFHF